MRKIISVFQRNYETDRLIRDEVVPGAEWVLAGEGIATRKFDGTCAMVRDGKLYKRYDAKQGKEPPPNFEPAQDYDPVTGHMPGWLPVGDGPEDRWFREAWDLRDGEVKKCFGSDQTLPDGTYELCGPKIQGNPEGFRAHDLVRHGTWIIGDHFAADPAKWDECPRTFTGIRDYLASHEIEGIVFHHPDGRMAKVKAKDFGFKRAKAPCAS